MSRWGGPRLRLQLTVLDPYRAVAQELQANREPDFSSLVSPLSPRRVAARAFYLLLGECGHEVQCGGRRHTGPTRTPPDWPCLLPLSSACSTTDPSRGTREAVRATPAAAGAPIPLRLELIHKTPGYWLH